MVLTRNNSRQREDTPSQQQPKSIEKKTERPPPSSRSSLDLMISKSQVSKFPVVRDYVLSKLDDSRLVLIVKVSLDKSPVELDGLAQRGMLTRRSIETSSSLDDLSVMEDDTGRARGMRSARA